MDLELATFWLTAVGTVATLLALIVATVLGVHEIRSLRREQAEREVERRVDVVRQRRAQAECVSAVLSVGRDAHTRLNSSSTGPAYAAYVTIVNSSALPIYDARPSVPNFDGSEMVSPRYATFVAGGAEGHVHVPAQASRAGDGEPVELRFRDAAAVYWHRLPDGELHESDASGDCPPDVDDVEIPAEITSRRMRPVALLTKLPGRRGG